MVKEEKEERAKMQVRDRIVGEEEPCFFVAEIGQNHNGDPAIAQKLIDVAAMPVADHFNGRHLLGVDAVKLTKRDLSEELTGTAEEKPYKSPHSFGDTYMEHRRALELSIEEHRDLEQYAHNKDLFFVETFCSPGCLELLETVDVDVIKIASRDVTNIPLLEALSEVHEPVILSSGMCTLDELDQAVNILSKGKDQDEIAILHCLSQYPAEYNHLNLRSINYLKQRFPSHVVGYSDHSIGIAMPVAARTLKSAIIEKHITLNRQMKGSDHHCSLEPDGLWRCVRDVRNTERALGDHTKQYHECVQPAREKLARSLSLEVPLSSGEVLRESHVGMRSPGSGMSWEEREKVIGKRAVEDLPANSLIREEHFE